MRSVKYVAAIIAVTGMLLAAFVGCGKRYNVCEVEGVLSCDGTPIPLTDIHFEKNAGERGGVAVTDASGHFVVRYMRDTAGLPPGEYKVFIGVQVPSKERDSIANFKTILNKYSRERSSLTINVDKPNKDLKLDLTAK